MNLNGRDERPPSDQRLTEALRKIDEVIDSLNLSVKYMEFDLEATRRENRRLRRMLERTGW